MRRSIGYLAGLDSLFAAPRLSLAMEAIDSLAFLDLVDRKADRPADHVYRLPPAKRGRFKASQRRSAKHR